MVSGLGLGLGLGLGSNPNPNRNPNANLSAACCCCSRSASAPFRSASWAGRASTWRTSAVARGTRDRAREESVLHCEGSRRLLDHGLVPASGIRGGRKTDEWLIRYSEREEKVGGEPQRSALSSERRTEKTFPKCLAKVVCRVRTENEPTACAEQSFVR